MVWKLFRNGSKTHWSENASRVLATKDDNAYFVKPGLIVALRDIESVLQRSKLVTGHLEVVKVSKSFENKRLKRHWSDGMETS